MQLSKLKKLVILKILISTGLLSGMIISWRLWVTDRLFPHFPVWEWFGPLSSPLDITLVIVVILLLFLSAWKPKLNKLTIALFILLVTIALQDQMRWQPWFYQYTLMLLPFLFFKWPEKGESLNTMIWLQQMIIISVYLWGGIHKAHAGFLSVYENFLVEPILENLQQGLLRDSIITFGYLIPLIEFLTALALFFGKTRKIGVITAIITHILILILLGPVRGRISNGVVWPWNIMMMCMVWVLFYKVPFIKLKQLNIRSLTPAIPVVLILTLITPALFYAEKWDRSLSFNLYAGRQKRLLVYIKENAVEKLPAGLEPYFKETKQMKGYRVLVMSNWSYGELQIPLITEKRIFKQMSEHLCNSYGLTEKDLFFYTDYKHLPDKGHKIYRCKEMSKVKLP